MTESLKLSASAVNKFLYYSQNWDNTEIEIKGQKMMLPGFFKIFEGSGLMNHFWGKFFDIYEKEGCRNALLNFYFSLDDCWRIAVLEYILTNYNCEIKLNFNKEDE